MTISFGMALKAVFTFACAFFISCAFIYSVEKRCKTGIRELVSLFIMLFLIIFLISLYGVL